MKTPVVWSWCLTLGLVVLFVIAGDPSLPDRLATHFDLAGNPNGWMTKSAFYAAIIGITILLNIWPLVIPAFVAKMPAFLNIPNKTYWLEPPARRAQVVHKLQTILLGTTSFSNCAVLMGYLVVWRYHLEGPQPFPWATFGVIVAGVLGVGLGCTWHDFRIPQASAGASAKR